MTTPRNYRKEYDNYHSKPEQIKRRASRNAARAAMKKIGLAAEGDNRKVSYIDGNPLNRDHSNIKIIVQ